MMGAFQTELDMLDQRFLDTVKPLLSVGMGTENVAWLLYSLIRMTRPHSVLEVGLGYTTPFLLKGLADNAKEWYADLEVLQSGRHMDARRDLLLPGHFVKPYNPKLIAIDDFSVPGSSATRVLEAAKRLALDSFLVQIAGDFRGQSKAIEEQYKPFDLVWFDCGGPEEYIEFLREYWFHCASQCLVALHFTYQWQEVVSGEDPQIGTDIHLAPGAVLTELKRQHIQAGVDAHFELLSIVEPHKNRQGSVTLLRRHLDRQTASPENLEGTFVLER